MIAPTIPYSAPQFAEACAQSQKAVERELNRFDTIILGAAWQGYARQAGFEPDFRSTVAELRRRRHRVILLGQIPPIPGFDRRCEQKALKVPVLRCRDRSSNVETRPRPFNDVLKGLAGEMEGVTYFDIEDMICRNGTCSAYFGSKPLYYDPGHLSMSGSWTVGRRLLKLHGVPHAVFSASIPDAGTTSNQPQAAITAGAAPKASRGRPP
jgi:hypothetical protein